MTIKIVAVLISSLGCVALLGCDTGVDHREGDAARPESEAADTQRYDTPSQTETTAERPQTDTAPQAMSGGLGAWSEWDADASGDVTKTEFDSRFASTSAWGNWDTNNDKVLDESEAAKVSWLQGKDMEAWDRDADGKLARTEAGDALWKMWDSNADNKLEQSEWKA
jgi:hypothetical protein